MHTTTDEEMQKALGRKETTLEDVMVELKTMMVVMTTLTEAFLDVVNSNNILALAIEKRNNEEKPQNES